MQASMQSSLPVCCVNVFIVLMYVVRWSVESCDMSSQQRKRRQHCHRSEITNYPRMKKSDDQRSSSLLLTLRRPLLVAGDVIIEFFNKPKMMKKVLGILLHRLHQCFTLMFNIPNKCCTVVTVSACNRS